VSNRGKIILHSHDFRVDFYLIVLQALKIDWQQRESNIGYFVCSSITYCYVMLTWNSKLFHWMFGAKVHHVTWQRFLIGINVILAHFQKVVYF